MYSILVSFLWIATSIGMIMLGIKVYKGDISPIHSYNRTRVINVKGYGKYMGLGVILGGIGFCLLRISLLLSNNSLLRISLILTNDPFCFISIIFIFAGITLIIYAQIRYNKGFF